MTTWIWIQLTTYLSFFILLWLTFGIFTQLRSSWLYRLIKDFFVWYDLTSLLMALLHTSFFFVYVLFVYNKNETINIAMLIGMAASAGNIVFILIIDYMVKYVRDIEILTDSNSRKRGKARNSF